ncbi:MAG: flagellar export protein FliJ [Deltaproteobacteria bacterium]|nr:MAG: flagellar export protein FliJ [Deltaproteobacteria bacterium]
MAVPFHLQTLLDYRQLKERQAKQSLASALQRQEAVLVEINRMRAELDCLCRDFVRRQAEGLPAAEIDLYQRNIQLRQHQLHQLEDELQQKKAEVAEARNLLLKISTEKKSVERLRDRHEREQLQRQKRLEGAVLDEIALRNLGEMS